jgi:hypothetical protein
VDVQPSLGAAEQGSADFPHLNDRGMRKMADAALASIMSDPDALHTTI